MNKKAQPTIVFITDTPAPATGDQEVFIIQDEDKKAYREAVIKPASASLSYPSDFSDPEIEAGSIAYHPVFGHIAYRSWWRFSTAQFMADLKAADENPNIAGHLIHIDSGGGEAFGAGLRPVLCRLPGGQEFQKIIRIPAIDNGDLPVSVFQLKRKPPEDTI